MKRKSLEVRLTEQAYHILGWHKCAIPDCDIWLSPKRAKQVYCTTCEVAWHEVNTRAKSGHGYARATLIAAGEEGYE